MWRCAARQPSLSSDRSSKPSKRLQIGTRRKRGWMGEKKKKRGLGEKKDGVQRKADGRGAAAHGMQQNGKELKGERVRGSKRKEAEEEVLDRTMRGTLRPPLSSPSPLVPPCENGHFSSIFRCAALSCAHKDEPYLAREGVKELAQRSQPR
ncbi:uncharacterized protein LOC144014169 [Festucalex cinctus]